MSIVVKRLIVVNVIAVFAVSPIVRYFPVQSRAFVFIECIRPIGVLSIRFGHFRIVLFGACDLRIGALEICPRNFKISIIKNPRTI